MASSSKKVGVKGKVIHSQGREIIANVLKFMKEEAENKHPIIPLTNYKERLMRAVGISDVTYRSIAKEAEDVNSGKVASFGTPHKTRPRKSTKSTLRPEDTDTIRSIIHNFYIHEKRRPSLKGNDKYFHINYNCYIFISLQVFMIK